MAKETRYPRTDTGNRSPHLVALNRDAPLRINKGEGRAVRGDAALLQWGSVGFYGTLLSPHTLNIGR